MHCSPCILCCVCGIVFNASVVLRLRHGLLRLRRIAWTPLCCRLSSPGRAPTPCAAPAACCVLARALEAMGGVRVRRRRGAERLHVNIRQSMSRFARADALGTTPDVQVEPTLSEPRLPVSADALDGFMLWYFQCSAPAEQRVFYHPHARAALELPMNTDPWRFVFLLAAFWRIDNLDVWKHVEPLLIMQNPNWSEVKRRLLLIQQCSSSRFANPSHQTHVVPAWKGVSLAEQHAAILQRWWRCLRKAKPCFGVAAPAAVACCGGAVVVDSMCAAKLAARLPLCGVYTAKNIVASLELRGLIDVKHGAGILGPGAVRGARLLLGTPLQAIRGHGLWPWQRDSFGVREVAHGLTTRLGISFADAQAALCYWFKWQRGQHARTAGA